MAGFLSVRRTWFGGTFKMVGESRDILEKWKLANGD